MNYEQALEVLKRREKVIRGGRVFQLQRALMDVTDPENPRRISFFEEGEEGDRVLYENFDEWKAAEDWGLQSEIERLEEEKRRIADAAVKRIDDELYGEVNDTAAEDDKPTATSLDG
jgi:hypothetical protein